MRHRVSSLDRQPGLAGRGARTLATCASLAVPAHHDQPAGQPPVVHVAGEVACRCAPAGPGRTRPRPPRPRSRARSRITTCRLSQLLLGTLSPLRRAAGSGAGRLGAVPLLSPACRSHSRARADLRAARRHAGRRARRRTAGAARGGLRRPAVRAGRRRSGVRGPLPDPAAPAGLRAGRGPLRRLPGRLRGRDAAAPVDLLVAWADHPAALRCHHRTAGPHLCPGRPAGPRVVAAAGHRPGTARPHPVRPARGTGHADRAARGRPGPAGVPGVGLAQGRAHACGERWRGNIRRAAGPAPGRPRVTGPDAARRAPGPAARRERARRTASRPARGARRRPAGAAARRP